MRLSTDFLQTIVLSNVRIRRSFGAFYFQETTASAAVSNAKRRCSSMSLDLGFELSVPAPLTKGLRVEIPMQNINWDGMMRLA